MYYMVGNCWFSTLTEAGEAGCTPLKMRRMPILEEVHQFRIFTPPCENNLLKIQPPTSTAWTDCAFWRLWWCWEATLPTRYQNDLRKVLWVIFSRGFSMATWQ